MKAFKQILENCKNWQYEAALNKENLSKFTCFSLALQNHVKMIIKQTISKILYSIEKLPEITKNLPQMEKETINQWKQSFMDKIIINIYNLFESKLSLMSNSHWKCHMQIIFILDEFCVTLIMLFRF